MSIWCRWISLMQIICTKVISYTFMEKPIKSVLKRTFCFSWKSAVLRLLSVWHQPSLKRKTAYRITSCQNVWCKLFFLFSFRRLFPLLGAFLVCRWQVQGFRIEYAPKEEDCIRNGSAARPCSCQQNTHPSLHPDSGNKWRKESTYLIIPISFLPPFSVKTVLIYHQIHRRCCCGIATGSRV